MQKIYFSAVKFSGSGCLVRRLARAPSNFMPMLRSFSTIPVAEVRKSPIYTKTGDKGTSMLFNGERRSKADKVFEALGHQDELNVTIGISLEYNKGDKRNEILGEMLTDIQSRIFDLGCATATPLPNSSEHKKLRTMFSGEHTLQLERWIDLLDSRLPELKNFILPSGGLFATHLHLARAVCRRAERATVQLVADGDVDCEVGKYLNRLSDFLFIAARTATASNNETETIWKKTRDIEDLK